MSVKAQSESMGFPVARIGTILALSICVVFSAHGDLLLTRDGERLSGTLTRVVDSILVFRTTLRGQMMLPMEEVLGLQTEDRWIVTLSDGNVFIGKLVADGIALDGEPSKTTTIAPLSYTQVSEIRQAPPMPESKERAWEEPNSWAQNLSTGAQIDPADGALVPYTQWEATHQNLHGAVGLRLRFDGPDGGYIANDVRGALHLSSAAGENRAAFLEVAIRRDRAQALEWRTGLTVGMRYDFSTREEVDVFAYLGVAAYYSRWENMGHYLRRADGQSEDGAALRAHLGLGYRQSLWGNAEWQTRFAVLPGLTSQSAIRAEAETVVTYPLTDRLRLRFDMIMSYESDPVFDALDGLDTTLGAGIQFEF